MHHLRLIMILAITVSVAGTLHAQTPASLDTASLDTAATDPDLPVADVESGKLRWVGSYEKARAEASMRHAPIVIVLANESDAFFVKRDAVFATSQFAKALGRVVPLIALNGRAHNLPAANDEKTAPDPLCKLFGVPCEQHEATYDTLYNRLVRRSYWEPLLIVLDPEGKEILRLEGATHDIARYLEEIAYAASLVEKEHGRAVDEQTWRRWMKPLAQARGLLAKDRPRDALAKIDALLRTPKITDEVRRFAERERTRAAEQLEKTGK